MINTIFYFTSDATFNYETALRNGDISEYTIVFNSADHSIRCKGDMFGRMNREDIVGTLLSTGDISDILPAATDNKLGGIKTGYTSNVVNGSKTYAVELDENNRAYVNVPWTDTITPTFDDSELQNAIDAQRTRIDNYISDLTNAIQDATESLLDDAEWVELNLNLGETGRQIKDDVDGFLRMYGVWDYADSTLTTKVYKIGSLKVDVDGIKAYTGMTTPSGYSGTNLTTALSQIYTDVGRDFQTGAVTANSGLMSEVSELDKNTNNIIKMAASALQLKTSLNGSIISSASDLASVIVNGLFTGYSGLNNTVTNQGNSIDALNSLMSHVIVKNGNNYTVQSDIISGVINSTTFTNGVATATASLSSTVDGHTAAIATKVSKDSSGKIESTAKISADLIYLSGNTFANSILADHIKTDVLEAGDATFTGTVNATNGNFSGVVNATNGTFRGNVEASTLIAGDPSGINIRTSSDRIEFCQGGDVRAYFVADGNGMQLHVWDSNGDEHYIDFTKWASVTGTTYTPVNGYLTRDTSSLTTPYVAAQLFKDQDGKFYKYDGSAYTLASCNVYTKRNANQYYSSGMNQIIPYIYAVASNTNTYAIAVTVNEYTRVTITNGVITATSSNHIYHCPDYPTSITVSNGNVSISRTGKFINPQGGSRTFGYMYDGQLHTWSPGKQRGYVTGISSDTEYSLPPFVYEESENAISL